MHQWIIPPSVSVGPTLFLVTAFIALMITAISKGGFGGGVGIVSVPLMLQVVDDPKFVIGLWLPVLISCDVVTIGNYPKQRSARVFWKLSPGMLLGILCATFLLGGMSNDTGTRTAALQEAWLKFGIALISLIFLVFQLRPKREVSERPWVPGWRSSLPIGFAGGITTTFAHAAGTIVNMYLIPQRLDKDVFVGTCGRFFCIFNSLKVPFMWAIGVMSLATLKYGLWMILLGPVGVCFGKWINTRISPVWFMRVIYACLVVAAGKLIIEWAMALF